MDVEAMLCLSTRHGLDQDIQDYPKCPRTMQKWPSMCTHTGSQMHWTSRASSKATAPRTRVSCSNDISSSSKP